MSGYENEADYNHDLDMRAEAEHAEWLHQCELEDKSGWSLEQKEAILKAVFRWEDGLKGNTQPAHNEKLLERLEAITKGEE